MVSPLIPLFQALGKLQALRVLEADNNALTCIPAAIGTLPKLEVLNLAMIVCSALMIWKSLMVITESESPVVVVLSGSMEPAFHRGDILFLHMGFTPFRSGDIVVFKVADREIPIVHRIIKVHEKEDGTVDLLTKGDNNAVDDRGLYAASQSWIHREHVIGRAKGCARERGTPLAPGTRLG